MNNVTENLKEASCLFYLKGGTIARDYTQKQKLLRDLRKSCYVVATPDGLQLAEGESALAERQEDLSSVLPCVGLISPLDAQGLGDAGFKKDYATKYAYMGGSMANGISSADMVIALGLNGFLGSFGSGGLSLTIVDEAIKKIKSALPQGPYAVNLLHSPAHLKKEFELISLFLKHGVNIIEASAFISISPALVYYRLSGLKRTAGGEVEISNRVIAKVSREEVALKFMQPAEGESVEALLKQNLITKEQAELSRLVPMADDITVEADSGGHTDNRPLVSILPAMISLRDRIQEEYHFKKPVRIGAAGGISTPHAAVGAFAMGAAYVVSGSVNQACIESGTSGYVRKVLSEASMADIMMAPCADMFEMGAKVEVLKKGTMFPMNAQKLYEVYRMYSSLEELPSTEKERLELRIFKRSIEDVWLDVVKYFNRIAPEEIERAQRDKKHKMALIFRWYLGNSSRWAVDGISNRQMDMQIWCGQSMGAFNSWVKGTYLEEAQMRKVTDVALHIMNGAAYLFRVNLAECIGVQLSYGLKSYIPENPFNPC